MEVYNNGKKGFLVSFFIFFIFSLSFSTSVFSQTYPTKPIEVIVPFAPGGSVEMGTRIMNNMMAEFLGQPMVIITKPGSGGAIGADYVAKAKPDGYTILSSSNSANVVSPAINANTTYTIYDFQPIGQYGTLSLLLALKSTSSWKTAQELIRYIKDNPGKLTYGTGGVGATTFMFAELFKKTAGIKIEHVPFKGSGPQIIALAGGHIDIGFVDIIASLGQIDAKKIRVLAVSGTQRDAQLPDVPTVSEIGYPDATFLPWQGYFVPKGTPQPIVEKLFAAFRRAIENPAAKESFRKIGFDKDYVSGEELQKRIEKEYKICRELAEKGGFLVK